MAQKRAPAFSYFWWSVLPVSPKSCGCWARAAVKVKVSESGGGTLHCTPVSEIGGGPAGWQRFLETTTVDLTWVGGTDPGSPACDPLILVETGRKGNAEPTNFTWGGSQGTHFFFCFLIVHFSPTMKIVTTFHCFLTLLLKTLTLSHVFLIHCKPCRVGCRT